MGKDRHEELDYAGSGNQESRWLLGMKWLDVVGDWRWEGEVMLEEVRVKPRYKGGDDTMIILKGTVNGQRRVAFHVAPSAADALAGAVTRFGKGELRWHEDKPYEG